MNWAEGVWVWPQIIGSIATGLTGLIVAVAGLLTARGRGSAEELESCRSRMALEQRRLNATLRHMYRLERMLSGAGLQIPQRPTEVRDLVS